MISKETLLQQIDDLVASKTFSLEAVDVITQIKGKLRAAIEDNEELKRRYDGLYETNGRQSDELLKLGKELEHLRAELAAAKALNDAGQKAIYEAEKHQAVAEAWQSALQTVFKPNTVRETVYQSIPISHHFNGNTSVVPYHQETKTTKEEL